MKRLFSFSMLILLSACKHPESKDDERKIVSVQIPEEDYPEENTFISADSAVTYEEITEESSVSENILPMENENGVKYVWIEINGLKLKFIFDTGASSICISSAEASVMYRQGTLRKEDIVETEYFQDATGTISEGTKINLRTVRVGDITLNNVKATVIDNADAPLLLGQSVLEKFGNIEIDNSNNIIIFK